MQNVFTQTIHVPGTLGANLGIYYKLPMDVQLVHVSANGSNTNNGLLTIGYTGTLAAYLASSSIGDGNVPICFDWNDFVGSQYPHISAGTVIAIVLDYDGASGTATADFTQVLTFTDG